MKLNKLITDVSAHPSLGWELAVLVMLREFYPAVDSPKEIVVRDTSLGLDHETNGIFMEYTSHNHPHIFKGDTVDWLDKTRAIVDQYFDDINVDRLIMDFVCTHLLVRVTPEIAKVLSAANVRAIPFSTYVRRRERCVVLLDDCIRNWLHVHLDIPIPDVFIKLPLVRTLEKYGVCPNITCPSIASTTTVGDMVLDVPSAMYDQVNPLTNIDKGVLFLDMDGVVADWQGHIIDNYYPEQNIRWLNKHPDRGTLIADIYSDVPHTFFLLKALEGAREAIRAMLDKLPAGYKVVWLSGIDQWHQSPHIASMDKARWLRENIYDYKTIDPLMTTIHSSEKADIIKYVTEHLSKKAIIVDDFDVTCDQVVAIDGATAILHTGDFETTLAALDASY